MIDSLTMSNWPFFRSGMNKCDQMYHHSFFAQNAKKTRVTCRLFQLELWESKVNTSEFSGSKSPFFFSRGLLGAWEKTRQNKLIT